MLLNFLLMIEVYNIMKIFIKITIVLVLATLSCPCELTGHKYCDHSQHLVINSRADIRQWRTTGHQINEKEIKNDSLAAELETISKLN